MGVSWVPFISVGEWLFTYKNCLHCTIRLLLHAAVLSFSISSTNNMPEKLHTVVTKQTCSNQYSFKIQDSVNLFNIWQVQNALTDLLRCVVHSMNSSLQLYSHQCDSAVRNRNGNSKTQNLIHGKTVATSQITVKGQQ